MFSITIKLMKKSARMLIPAGIAILIGTAFIAATFLFSNSMDDSLRRQSTAQLGEANYIATMKTNSNGAVSENGSADRTTVADFNLDRIRATKGVKGVRVDTSVSVSISAAGKRSNGYAVGTSTDRKLLPVRIVSGDQPVDNNEVALPKSVAKQLGVGVGDKVDVAPISNGSALSGTAVRDVRVVGLTGDPFGVYSFYGGASVLSENVVAAVYGVDDFDHMQAYMLLLDIDDADAAAAQRTVDEVSGLLPKSYGVESRRSVEAEAVRDLSSNNTSFPTIFLLSFGVLALFVAALVIANTFQVLVAQRRRTLALLRTIGAKKGQLYTSVLMEAGLLGLIASVLGVGFGVGLIALVTNTGVMEMMGMQARLILSWQAFVVPIAFGLIMTVLASLGSARSATSVTPLEALRPIELTDTSRAGKVRATIGVLTIIAGLALAGVAVWQLSGMLNGLDTMASDNYSSVLLMSIGGAALVFLGLVLTATFWLPVLMRGVGALVSMCGPSAKVAHANIQKNPRRVAATGTALLIGVTLVATIATGAASAKQTMGEALASRYSVDMIATGDGLKTSAVKEAAQVKGVAATMYAPTATVTAEGVNGGTMSLLLVGVKNASELAGVMHADLSGVTVGDDTVLLPKYRATSGKEITFGSDAKLRFTAAESNGIAASTEQDGSASASSTNGGVSSSMRLKPVQSDYRRVSSNYDAVAFINTSHFNNGDITATGHMLLMRVDTQSAGVSLSDVFNKIQDVFSYDSTVSITGPVAERAQWETIINSMLMLLVALIAVAVLIALIGVANTLSLSVIERTRESATLRAIGMTRGQLRRSLAVEALLLSLVAGVVGVVLGTLFGWLGSYMVFSLYGKTVFPFEWGMNGIVLVVAAIAALLASVFPARRAVKTPPVEALAEA